MTEERKIELLKMRFASEKEAKQMAKKLGPAWSVIPASYNGVKQDGQFQLARSCAWPL